MTFASRTGALSHFSVLRMKARRLGLVSGDSLIALAVRRGCRHFSPYVEAVGAETPDTSEEDFSNEELAVALLLGSWPHEPVMVRVAAQLLSGRSIQPKRLARLAVLERCEAALRHIAECGRETEPENEFWRDLLEHIPSTPLPRPGSLPHPSRFRSETGIVNPRKPETPRMQWLRPWSEK